MAETKHGFLVLADISGFTAFVTATELEHGPPIIAELLEEVIRRISPPLDIQGIEGDAVFALGPHGKVLPPASLLDVLHAGFVGFREKQRELEADDSCSCNACRERRPAPPEGDRPLRHLPRAHRRRPRADRRAGRDPRPPPAEERRPQTADYALLTRPALQYMEVDPARLGLLPHTERYEHFGDVECFVHDVSYAALGAG